MSIDLDKLTALLGRMTPGEWQPNTWNEYDGNGWTAIGPVHEDEDSSEPGCEADVRAQRDAAGIVALVNASAELLRLARVGQAYLAWTGAYVGDGTMPSTLALAAALDAATEGP